MDPIDTSLIHHYYLYEKSSNKTCELKVLFDEPKEVYKIDGKGFKPIQAAGYCWVDTLKAMSRLASNFRVYTQHLKNVIAVIADMSKKYDCVTVKGAICTGAIIFVDKYVRTCKKLELENAEKQFKHNWCYWCSRGNKHNCDC